MGDREPAVVTPFWVRIATETSLSPGWLLIAFPAVIYPTYLVLEVLFGRGLAAATDFGGDGRVRLLMFTAASAGYLASLYVYVARGTCRDLEALRPLLREGDATYAELQRKLSYFERRSLRFGGFLGFVAACVIGEMVVGLWTQRILPGEWSVRDFCFAVILIGCWILACRGSVYLIDSAQLYSRIGERHVVVDLLDLAPLSPLTRHGLRIVLLLAIISAAVVVYSILDAPSPPTPTVGAMISVFTICLLNAVAAAVAFLLPVRGLRRQIRARKAEELAKVRGQIRRDNELVARAGPDSAEAGARLPGLIAYMNQIESVREWPFDAPTLTRFFLYVAIPLGSWVGGALVERLLGAALD